MLRGARCSQQDLVVPVLLPLCGLPCLEDDATQAAFSKAEQGLHRCQGAERGHWQPRFSFQNSDALMPAFFRAGTPACISGAFTATPAFQKISGNSGSNG
jgi:hypothetical protein